MTTSNTVAQQLEGVVDALNHKITPSSNHEDGRVNSIDDEASIIALLKTLYGDDVEEPKARHWWDVKIFGHPVQIKSSSFAGADNFSSKAAILYALTQLDEEQVQVKSWRQFEEALLGTATHDNNRDYFIITLNKTDGKVYLTSLKTLNKLQPNGNNLPFQINWKQNTTSVTRTHTEAYHFIVDAYKASVTKKINTHPLYDLL